MKLRLLITLSAFILLQGLFFACGNTHPTDGKLLNVFQSHEEEFNALIRMANKDSKVIRISPEYTWLDNNFNWPRPESELGFSKERWEEYRRLFQRLNLQEGVAWYSVPGGPILLLSSVKGKFAGSSEKGYAYSTTPLTPLAESLDNVEAEADSRRLDEPIYKKIKDNWYLYYKKD